MTVARTLVIGTAGHIDHGKSALVRALTGTDPDRLKEEQARGITIELGFAHATIGDVDVAFVDVPGHERFVRTMLAGAGGLDAVMLIVAADEAVMPQTREHFDICRLLGISRGLIVITKTDLVDDETIALAELEARELVAGSVLEDVSAVAVSAQTGAGLDRLRLAIAALATTTPRAVRRGVARLPIDRAFSVRGFGTVVTGTLVSGEVREGDALTLLPGAPGGRHGAGGRHGGGENDVRVRGLHVHGQAAALAVAPRRVAVNLGGVDLAGAGRGMTLASANTLAVTRRVDVHVELLAGARPLRHGARVRMHQGTGDWLARVALSSIRSNASEPWTRVEVGATDVQVPSGGEALVRLRLADRAVLTRGDRVVLRAPSPAVTIGGATVLDPEPHNGGVRRARVADRLQALVASDPTVWLPLWLLDESLGGLTTEDVVRRGGVGPDEAEAVANALVDAGVAVRSGGRLVHAASVAAAQAMIVSMLGDYHRAHPEEIGIARQEVRDRVGADEVFDTLLSALGAKVTGTDRLALAAHQPQVTGEDARVRQAVDATLKAAGLQPPDVATLSQHAGASGTQVQAALRALQRDGRAQRLDVLWFHADTLQRLKTDVKTMGSGATVDVAAAKARFGVSRKFAIPLLEFLDRERLTRRVGNQRIVI